MRASGAQPGDSHLSLSATGTLAYIPGGPKVTARRTLALVDRSGKAQVLPMEPKAYLNPRISPDGKRVAVGTDDGVEAAIWIYELGAATTLRRLTVSEPGGVPLWSYDGRYVIFRLLGGVFRRLADGIGAAEEIVKVNPAMAYMPFAVEPFGKALAFGAYGNTGVSSGGILILSLNGDQKTQPIPDNPSSHAAFSPDGRWLAFTTPATRRQLFVRPYPTMNAKFEIIADGGNWPVWSPDGKQIFYVRPPNRFFAVDIVTEPTFNYKTAVELPITGTIHDFGGPRNFDITPDGKHFLVVMPAAQNDASQQAPVQINIVLNWFSELQQRVPVK
jgi:dipeptidyl aminopeptidase/acylaminoacyl peptidase